MSVRVKIRIIERIKRITISSLWLKEKDGKWGVFIVKDRKARFKEVKIASYSQDKVIISSGLKDGDLVIINPSGIRDGDLVKKQILP
jgi:hypothetical protein